MGDKKMARNIKELYFGSEDISKQNVNQFVKLSGDHMFYGGTEIVVRELVKTSQHHVFRYMYSHKGDFTLVDTFLLNPLVMAVNLLLTYLTGGWKLFDFDMGVCHADELFVMF